MIYTDNRCKLIAFYKQVSPISLSNGVSFASFRNAKRCKPCDKLVHLALQYDADCKMQCFKLNFGRQKRSEFHASLRKCFVKI